MTEEEKKDFDKACEEFEEHFIDDPGYGIIEGARHMTEEEIEQAGIERERQVAERRQKRIRRDVLGGIVGLCIGDALGLPVQFERRERFISNPVTDMTGYGTFNLPPGSWSDDTSMTLCLLDSLSNGLDYNDIMKKFALWLVDGEYTPYGKAYDIGGTTMASIFKYVNGVNLKKCGGTNENDNGNGSLMRTLPVAFYLHLKYNGRFSNKDEAFDIIHNVSALTHAHKRSMMACGIYCIIAENLIYGFNTRSAVTDGLNRAKKYYENKDDFINECKFYNRLFDSSLFDLPESDIKSSGYVVDTLEAAVWCLYNTHSYEECVLKAVNLGGDTDTIAAVAGGLAGLYYGFDAIPVKWVEQIPRMDFIRELCEKLY